MSKAKCYTCVHRREIAGDAHSRCNNMETKVVGNPIGINNGWFRWPFNFDPVWLQSCEGFSDNPKDNLPETAKNPLVELLSILR